jgi:hypothetical protein
VAGEQSVEDRRGDHVRCEHRDCVITGDGVVEVVLQPLVELRESLGYLWVGSVDQDLDPGDQGRGDVGEIVGPVFPLGAGADLVDDAGVDRLLPLREREQRHLRCQPPAIGTISVRDTDGRVGPGVIAAARSGAITAADAVRVLRRRADVPTEAEVWDLIAENEAVPDETVYLVAAAMRGDDELAGQLGGDAPPPEQPKIETTDAPPPVRAFLRSITVSEFRGIGGRATLEDLRGEPLPRDHSDQRPQRLRQVQLCRSA